MKYIGIIHYDGSSRSQMFHTEKDAKDWLDSINNNAEYRTVIDMYDDKWNLVDGYIYTERAK